MKAKGLFMYKSIQDREKGSFTNKETGEVVNYDACKVLVCDEIDEKGQIKERRFKIANDNISIIDDFLVLEPYTKVNIEFEVAIYSSNSKVTPISFEVV